MNGSLAITCPRRNPEATLPRAAGSPARVYKIAPDGKAAIIFAPQELQVQALAVDKNGVLYAATNPDGKFFHRRQHNHTLGAINQVLIFAPILAVLAIRRQPWTSAWLPRARIATRLLVGVVLATLAVAIYSLLRDGVDAPWVLLGRIWRYRHVDKMVQVFLEDLTIAILFVRLSGAIGSRTATVVVACLFAAGHIPAMLANGATWLELAGLLRDAGLGVAVIFALQRSRDVVWFWAIHYCLDMTQFAGITGVE
jgi:hypothetical protein